jgi:hypothetical protein
MCNLYSITTNQEAIIRLFRVINRYVGKLAPMPGVFPDYPAPVVRAHSGGLFYPWSSDMIISVAIMTAGPQLTKTPNHCMMLLSSCMAHSPLL